MDEHPLYAIPYFLAGAYTVYRLLSRRTTPNPETYHLILGLVVLHGILVIVNAFRLTDLSSPFIFQFMAFSMMFLTLVTSRPFETPKVALFTWPLAMGFMIWSLFASTEGVLSENNVEHASSIFLHISLAMIGFASFFLLTLTAILYLWQTKKIKSHANLSGINFMPNMVQLESIQAKSLLVGVITFTLAIGLGKLSPYLWDIPHKWTSKEILSVIIWLLYFILALVRMMTYSKRHIFAFCSVAGFCLVIITFFALRFISPEAISGGL